MKKISAVILAAGEGTRLNEGDPSPKPKVLYEVAGKPMLFYSLEILKSLGIDDVVIVVGHLGEQVKKAVDGSYKFALQEKVTGTGEATRIGLEKINSNAENILVLNGADVYQETVVQKLILAHLESNSVLSFLTVEMEDPTGYGRIVRDEKGNLIADVEEKVATEEQKKIKEVNDGCYIFQREWLEQSITKLKLSGSNEYFLTDLIEMAILQGKKVTAQKMEVSAWFGVDTQKQIDETSQVVKKEWNKKE